MNDTKSFNGAEIVDSVSLVSFARSHGQAKFCKGMTNKSTGEVFDSLAFVNGNEITFVAISKNLTDIKSARDIARRKEDLQVVTFETGGHVLCQRGQSAWEDIDLI